MAILEILTDTGEASSHELTSRETVIGRHPNCDVVLRDTTISRRHARILCEKDGFFIEDMGSQHGTLVNESQLRSRERLNDRDQIRVMDTVLTFHVSSDRIADDDPTDEVDDGHSTIITSRTAASFSEELSDVKSGEKLRALLEITRVIGDSLDVKQIFPEILDSVFRIFPQATRGHILLANAADGNLVPQAVKQTDDNIDTSPRISRTIARRVISQGEAILSSDAGMDERFRASDSIANLEIRSVMCAPLIGSSKQPLGMIQIETKERKRQFTDDDLEVLVNVANLSGQLVEHARLHETQLQFDRRERDLAFAKQVQLHFLPQNRPKISGYQVCDFYQAAEGVGGDYYGYIELPDGRQAIAMGDVAGKGVSAALLMARLCSDVRFCLVTNPSPAEAVQQLDAEISKFVVSGQFVTFALCVLDPARHELVVVNAGHLPPLWRRAATGVVEPVGQDVASPPLGVNPLSEFRQTSIQMQPGDAILLYTDGVSEAANKDLALFGTQRVKQLLSTQTNAEAIIVGLLNAVRGFARGVSQSDDICTLCLSRDSAGP